MTCLTFDPLPTDRTCSTPRESQREDGNEEYARRKPHDKVEPSVGVESDVNCSISERPTPLDHARIVREQLCDTPKHHPSPNSPHQSQDIPSHPNANLNGQNRSEKQTERITDDARGVGEFFAPCWCVRFRRRNLACARRREGFEATDEEFLENAGGSEARKRIGGVSEAQTRAVWTHPEDLDEPGKEPDE
jgi:hypothetical protein